MRSSARVRESTAKKMAAAAKQAVPGTVYEGIPLSFDENEQDNASLPPPLLTLDEVNESLTVTKLQYELRRHGLRTAGRKSELLARLRGQLGNEAEYESVATSSELATSPKHYRVSVEREQEVDDDKSKTPLTATMAPPPPPPLLTTTVAPPSPTSPILPMAAAVPTAPDPRTLKIQYQGKPVDTIKFDLTDKLALEGVQLTLRSLFPDAKVNVDSDVDAEPIYLVDEYNELHIITLEFLKVASLAPTDRQAASTYQVRRGPLPSALEDDKLKLLKWSLALGCSAVQLALVWGMAGISPLSAIRALGYWVHLLFRESRTQGDFSLSAAICLCAVYLMCAVLLSAFLSPSHRFGIKLWFPRLLAFKADAQRAWRKQNYSWNKRLESFQARYVFRYAQPLPSRMGLPQSFNWPWLLTKRYFSINLLVQLRGFLVEAMVLSFFIWQLDLPPGLLLVGFFRPSRKFLNLPGLAKPGQNWDVLGAPEQFCCVGRTANTLTLKWAAPNTIPQVETTWGSKYSLGLFRYELEYRGQVYQYVCAPPRKLLQRPPPLDEIVLAMTTVFHLYHVSFLVALVSAGLFLVAMLTVTEDNNKRSGMTVCLENLDPDQEFSFKLTAFDELDRAGGSSAVMAARTHPKTMFRRLLLASEEVVRRGDPVAMLSNTRGQVRYSGVVWNAAMDDKDTEMFLRTLRSAFLPDPRKSHTDADFVFSDALQRNVHQVVSKSFLRQLAQDTGNAPDWRHDPFLVVHPAGTRHTFARETIYNHLVIGKQTMDYVLVTFGLLTVLLHSARYANQKEEDLFWNPVLGDSVAILAYLWVLSNLAVPSLNALAIKDFGVRPEITNSVLGVVDQMVGPTAFPVVKDLVLWLGLLFWCATLFATFGAYSFTSFSMSLVLWFVVQPCFKVISVPTFAVAILGVGLVSALFR
ncbi:hypothetical protein BASA81_003551 [Batrachochytrium salamandrivorans]|nr:hypothetical protein BASA81_003551 [Batrachochytrium salamandrivorans]